MGRRRLRNTVLGYLQESKDTAAAKICFDQFNAADCMTDKLAAVGCLASFDDGDGNACPERGQALSKFYEDANGDFLVLNKWFGIQVSERWIDLADDCMRSMLGLDLHVCMWITGLVEPGFVEQSVEQSVERLPVARRDGMGVDRSGSGAPESRPSMCGGCVHQPERVLSAAFLGLVRQRCCLARTLEWYKQVVEHSFR